MSPVNNRSTRKGLDESKVKKMHAPVNIIRANHDLEWALSAECYPIAKMEQNAFIQFARMSMSFLEENVLRTRHRPFIHPTPVVMLTFSSKVKPVI